METSDMSSPGGGQGKEERRRGDENSSPDIDQVYTSVVQGDDHSTLTDPLFGMNKFLFFVL